MNDEALKCLLSQYDFKTFVSGLFYSLYLALENDNVDKDEILQHILRICRVLLQIFDENDKKG